MGDWLLVLSHSLAELNRVFLILRLLVGDTVKEVSEAKIEKGITFIGNALTLSELFGPELDGWVAMVDERDKFPKRGVECVGELWLTLVRIVLASL